MKKMTRVEKKKRRRRRSFVVLLMIILIIVANYTIRRIDFFNVKKIRVFENKKVKSEKIINDSRIDIGTNIFNVDIKKAKKIIKKNPYVESVRIKRKIPNQINIAIVERIETYQVEYTDNTFLILDKRCIILSRNDVKNEKLTTIKGMKFNKQIDDKQLGKNILDYVESEKTKKLFKVNESKKIVNTFKEIDLTNDKEVVIIDKNNKKIEFGKIRDIDYKLDLLKQTIDYVETNNIDYEKILMNKGENPIIVEKRREEVK